MKAEAQQDTEVSDPNRKRRFRFTRKQIDTDMEKLDELVAKVDALQAERARHIDEGDETGAAEDVDSGASDAVTHPETGADVGTATASSPVAPQPVVEHASPVAPAPSPAETGEAFAIPTQFAEQAQQETPEAARPATREPAQTLEPAQFLARETEVVPSPSAGSRSPLGETTPGPAPGGASLADVLGVNVERIVRVLEEETREARIRIDRELIGAQSKADELMRQAEYDAEYVRQHAQEQARVLLSEVEEIISEAQHTGQQILLKADADADQIRAQASLVLDHAQEESRKIIDVARGEGEQILAEQRRLAAARAQEALQEQDRLKDQIRRLEERRRQVLESLEPLIDQLSQMIPSDRNVVQLPQNRR